MAATREIVVLDACVLYPAPLRDLLLSLASAGLYQARWTHMIQAEWITNLLLHRPDLQPEALARTAELMNHAVENSLVNDFEELIDSIVLRDPKDRHVVAAAIRCQADSIVTFNTKDFPQQGKIKILHPDDFCCSLYVRDRQLTLDTVRTLRRRLRRPAKTAQELIATYERQGLLRMSALLRNDIQKL
jgi:predicted nucleic acid-binding protein